MTAAFFIATPKPLIREMIMSGVGPGSEPFLYDVDKELGWIRTYEEFTAPTKPGEMNYSVDDQAISDLYKVMKGHLYSITDSPNYHIGLKEMEEGYYEQRVNEVVMFMEFLKRHVKEMGEVYFTIQWVTDKKYADTVEIRHLHVDDLKYGLGVESFDFEMGLIYHFI